MEPRVLPLLFFFSIWCGYLLYTGKNRLRAVASLPLSRIRSAAQGYVELIGRVRQLDDGWLVSPLQGRRCVYYRLEVRKRAGSEESHERTEKLQVPAFILDDGTGHCIVEPEGADYAHLRWSPTRYALTDDPGSATSWRWYFLFRCYHFREQVIGLDESIYALGEFSTQSGPTRSQLLTEALRTLKDDQAALRERFDRNGDGIISADEWAEARAVTDQEVSQALLREAGAEGPLPVLRKPRQSHQHFIISSEVDEARLVSSLRRRVWFGWAGLVLSLAILLFVHR
jgi:hypothetical protein